MESKVNYRLVGLFTIIVSVLFGFFVVWLSNIADKSDLDRYSILVTESVSGLNVGAPVKYRGVIVGSVKDIEINRQNSELIELTVDVKEDTPIRVSSKASLKPQGITGLSFVDIIPGEKSSKLLKEASKGDVPIIDFEPSLFSKFDSSFTTLVDALERVVAKTDKLFSDNNAQQLTDTLQNVADIAKKTSERLDEIGVILGSSKQLPNNLTLSLNKISTAADSVNSAASKLDRALEGKDFDFKKDITSITKEANRLLEDMRNLSNESNALVKEIQKNPSSIIFNSSVIPSGPGE